MNFDQRLSIGTAFQNDVAATLEDWGWIVTEYGQALLSQTARRILQRDALARHRWLPDLLAYNEDIDQRVLVDAKGGRGPDYAIEKASLQALAACERETLMPVYVVFHDYATARAVELVSMTDDPRVCRNGPHSTTGSGTPYWLISRTAISTTMRDVFA